MWTPKRIVLLALGFFVFFSGYMLYSTALGGIDGLPPLPAADLPRAPGAGPVGPPPSHGLKLEDKLRQAFGQDCPELKWPLKLELNSKNMVVAARDFTIEDDGRLKLDRVSVALFKAHDDGKFPEINTVRAKQAYLTFDKKLGQNDKDFGGRRIIAAELLGDDADNIEIVNNHRTAERDKHLHLDIVHGPLYYDEAKSLIWTDDEVRVEDDQNQPPTVVTGRGMEVHLAAAEVRPDAKPAPRQAAGRRLHRRGTHRPEVRRRHEPVRFRRLPVEPAGGEGEGRPAGRPGGKGAASTSTLPAVSSTSSKRTAT